MASHPQGARYTCPALAWDVRCIYLFIHMAPSLEVLEVDILCCSFGRWVARIVLAADRQCTEPSLVAPGETGVLSTHQRPKRGSRTGPGNEVIHLIYGCHCALLAKVSDRH